MKTRLSLLWAVLLIGALILGTAQYARCETRAPRFVSGKDKKDGKGKVAMNLLPLPKKTTQRAGEFTLGKNTRIFIPADVERPEWLAVVRLRDRCEAQAGVRPTLDRLGPNAAIDTGIVLKIQDSPECDRRLRDGYTLQIGKKKVQLVGNSPSGLFYGLQTLTQLVERHGKRLPAMKIVDEPDFAYRGFYHDVTRGKVPKLETLKWLVDYLAALKVNMFQLYVEHTFAFRFDPEIAKDCSPLEPDEILQLQEYCRDRRIDLVPSLQSFGHMGHILSMPKYRHLADVEPAKSWEEMTWYDRMLGATINTTDPEARALLERMFEDFLPLFDSPFVNVCADETYDLGKGKSKSTAEEIGVGRLYLQHIAFLNDLCKKHGKQMMFWGDIVKRHPDLVPEIPKDTILLNWGYHQNTKYESTKLFTDAELDVFVCPGASGWNRLTNGIGNADLNIRRYAAAGKKYGALGLLNTDWGDYGHYNSLSGSLHPIALGAAMAWNTKGPKPEAFDQAWNRMIWGDAPGKGVEALRDQAWIGDLRSSWTRFFTLFGDSPKGDPSPAYTKEEGRKMIQAGKAAARVFKRYELRGQGESFINAELRHGSLMNELMGEKALLALALQENGDRRNARLAARLEKFAERTEALQAEYETIWRNQNKESNLRDIQRAIRALTDDARARARQLRR